MSVRSGGLPRQSSEEDSSSGEETRRSQEEERLREVRKYARWEPIVAIRVAEFYEGIRPPAPNEFFRMTSTMVPCDEQYTYRFGVMLYSLMEDGVLHPLRWVEPGQVEITYIADECEIRRETIRLQLSQRNRTGSVATLTDNIGWEPRWRNFLLICLKFNENTIKYLKPNSTPEELEVVEGPKIRHYKIYASPEVSLGHYFDDFGQAFSNESNQEPSRASEAAESPGSNASSEEDWRVVLTRNPDAIWDWFWGDLPASWEKFEFHCEIQWMSTGPLGYIISFLKVLGNVNDERLQLQLIEPQTIRANVEYYTDQEYYKREEPITLQVSPSGNCYLMDHMENRTWNNFIAIGLWFDPLSINYEYHPRTSDRSERATIQAMQKIYFLFNFSSREIRGKEGENESNPRVVERPLPDTPVEQ